jgi:hypothetical protein
MPDFTLTEPGIESAALGALVVTPNNDTDLTFRIRAITIGGTPGTVSYIGWDGVTYTTDTLPAGTYIMFATRIRATGTTATAITGWK